MTYWLVRLVTTGEGVSDINYWLAGWLLKVKACQ